MRNRLYLGLGIWIGVALALLGSACTPDEEVVSTDPGLSLLVDTDTVIFDTLFSTVGSVTERLTIYNPNANAVVLDRLGLGLGDASAYRVIINGEARAEVQNEYLRGGDSLLVMVSITIDPADADLPFLVRDSLVMEWNEQRAHVKLLAWGQDAIFLGNEVVTCDITWTADRPYVIYDDILVAEGCRLSMEPGTRVYFNQGASLLVGGTLQVRGDSGQAVTFQNSRLDPAFDDVPGQWGGILFGETSYDNVIEYAQIRNAITGLYIGIPDNDTLPDVTIGHTIIENMASYGILAYTSDVYAYNTQVSGCLEFNLAHLAGGYYRYDHCTFFTNNDVPRIQESILWADNVVLADGSVLAEDLEIRLHNTIIWGPEEEEIFIDNSGGAGFTIVAQHCIVKSNTQIIGGTEVLYGSDPVFVDPDDYDLRLDSLSPAVNRGLFLGIEDDLRGMPRLLIPDLGAYERR